MAAHRFVAVVGSRELPPVWAARVAEVVGSFVARGRGIGSGGARGADQFALGAVVASGAAACRRSVLFLPGARPAAPGGAVGAFVARGGRVVTGAGVGRAARLGRSARLARASSGVVAFLWGPSRGSVFTAREAIRSGRPAAVVLAGGSAVLPAFGGGAWAPCSFGSVAAFRWVPAPDAPSVDGDTPRRSALHRVFVVPDGEPVEALLAHISSLSTGERLWFERGVLAGDTVMAPHEVLCDTPALLALPRLRRRFHCTAREAAGLAELFLALDVSPAVVAHYESEARRLGVAAVVDELVFLVARVALAEQVSSGDALEDAEALGDAAETITTDRRVTETPPPSEADGAFLGWHALGSITSETVTCAVCGIRYDTDDDAVDMPSCPECSAPDIWESRQGAAFRALVGEIDGCASLVELAALGKRLYAVTLPHDQAGVAWSHYQLHKAALEAAVTLGTRARALVGEVGRSPAAALPALGARLYRLQHGADPGLRPEEWRRIWQAYHARRGSRAA